MYRLAKMVYGYPLALAGEYTASTFNTLEDALAALGEHEQADGYAGTFNPRHPTATDYYLVARSTRDNSLVVITDSPNN